MPTLTRQDLLHLAKFHHGACVSMYVETHPTGEEGQQGPIELRNHLKRAEELLVEHGQRSVDARDLLAEAHTLADHERFWKDQTAGLAVFVAPGWFQTWKLPRRVNNFLWVGPRFHLKPLLPLVEFDERYYLLAVSQNQVKFYAGSATGLEPLDLSALPATLDDAARHEPLERSGQVHTGQPSLRGKQRGVFHGQTDVASHQKDELRIMFRDLDAALHPLLERQSAPLVFAGVEYLFPLYQAENTYSHLLDHPLPGNPEQRGLDELHRQASTLLQPLWSAPRTHDLQRFERVQGTHRVSANLDAIISAAIAGRVESVFVADDVAVWGQYDPAQRRATIQSPSVDSRCEDLLDRIAVETFVHGGRVHVVPAQDIPGGPLVAALFRYPIAHEGD